MLFVYHTYGPLKYTFLECYGGNGNTWCLLNYTMLFITLVLQQPMYIVQLFRGDAFIACLLWWQKQHVVSAEFCIVIMLCLPWS